MNIKEAKELFLKYGCSLFHMSRADDHTYDYYKSFGITEEQEREWSKEYQQELFDKIEKENVENKQFYLLSSSLVDAISNNSDAKGVRLFLNMIKRKIYSGDSFTQALIAKIIHSLIDKFVRYNKPIKKELILEAKTLSIEILNYVINNKITVAEHYRNSGNLGLTDMYCEKNIISRCKEYIGFWDNPNPSTKKKRKGKNKDAGGV